MSSALVVMALYVISSCRIGTVGSRDPGQNLINKSDGVRKTEKLPTG